MKYLKLTGNVNIEKLYLTEKFELYINFSGLVNSEFIFTGIENISLNKLYFENEYDFLVNDIINRKINYDDYDLVNKYFPIKYDIKYFLKNVSQKLSILLIEGDITIYLMYKNHEKCNFKSS